MKRICNTCKIELVKNNYIKDRTVCKSCTIKIEEKTIVITPLSKLNNQKAIITMTMIKR